MWSQYDEDLSQNTFFKEIKQNHGDILKKSAEKNWIICVPRTGSLISDNLINIILDHILIKENENHFTTLSKKELCLENDFLKGEQNSVFSSVVVRVLFEETHYIEETNKYIVWCVERPLFLLQSHCDIPNNNVTLTTIQDCIDFLYAETFGYNVLENTQRLCLDFWKTHEDSFEMESLQCQRDFIGNLFSQCLQLFYKTGFIKEKCDKSEQFWQLFKVSIETYMQYCLGKRLVYCISTAQHINDCILNKIIRNSLNVSLTDLNISENFSDSILNAKYELYRINNFVTALDKLNCLSRAFKIFHKHSSHSDEQFCVTSDDFLQILVYLILHSNIPNWAANLTYIKEFNFSTLENSDQNSFLITSLEAALEFIKSSQFLDITHTDKLTLNSNCEQNLTLFHTLYEKIKSDRNDSAFSDLLNKDICDFYTRVEKCHPLCTCQKCEQLVNQTPRQIFQILNEYNQNFFIMACIENNVNLLEYFLSLDFDINFRDSFGKTALHHAAEKGFQDVLLLLVNSMANVNVLDNERNTPLHLACDRGHENCVKALIYSSYVVEINLQNNSGETPLFLATKWGYFDIIKILLENGASVCAKNHRNMSVYKLSPNLYITRLFKEFGSLKSNIILEEVIRDIGSGSSHSLLDVTESDCNNKVHTFKDQSLVYGHKPKNSLEVKQIDMLIRTVESNDLPLTCFYLGYNSSIGETEQLTKKCHPLCTCTRCLKNNDIDLFDEQTPSENINKTGKFKVNAYNNDGFTPLHIAAKFGRTEILRILLDSGAFLNVRTVDTLYTPLHLAVMFQRVQTVKELLQCGDCNIDAQDYKGNTPLYYACVKNNNLKIIEILLQNRADCQKRNSEDKSILQACEEKNLFRVCRILRESIGYFSPKINPMLDETMSSNSNASFGDIDSDFEVL